MLYYEGLESNGLLYQYNTDEPITLAGVYQLAMIGSERLDIQHQFQTLTNGPAITLVNLGGVVVLDDEGNCFQLLEHFEGKPYDEANSYYPAGGLPDDSALVIRASDIVLFEASIADDEAKPITKQLDESKMIGAIALCLAAKAVKYKHGERPNAKAIAEDVVALLSGVPDAKLYGLADTKIRTAIASGIEALTSIK